MARQAPQPVDMLVLARGFLEQYSKMANCQKGVSFDRRSKELDELETQTRAEYEQKMKAIHEQRGKLEMESEQAQLSSKMRDLLRGPVDCLRLALSDAGLLSVPGEAGSSASEAPESSMDSGENSGKEGSDSTYTVVNMYEGMDTSCPWDSDEVGEGMDTSCPNPVEVPNASAGMSLESEDVISLSLLFPDFYEDEGVDEGVRESPQLAHSNNAPEVEKRTSSGRLVKKPIKYGDFVT